MARITIDDCLQHVHSRFDLTLIAAKRARQLTRGAEAKLPWHDHKSTVLALQEIAGGQVTSAILDEADLPAQERPQLALDALDPHFE
ncbi:MAG TPA: DNA-directed RNA polymerase subunit omega [Nevskiaceae bacterium]|nr:DNA-directed RNA polymerase subunit omega [Nevskiaceae bacterium]